MGPVCGAHFEAVRAARGATHCASDATDASGTGVHRSRAAKRKADTRDGEGHPHPRRHVVGGLCQHGDRAVHVPGQRAGNLIFLRLLETARAPPRCRSKDGWPLRSAKVPRLCAGPRPAPARLAARSRDGWPGRSAVSLAVAGLSSESRIVAEAIERVEVTLPIRLSL